MEIQENEAGLPNDRKITAHKRWKMLINVLTKKRCTVDNSVSVRRFASFGLLSTDVVDSDIEKITNKNGQSYERRHIWYKYSSTAYPEYEACIRHLDGSLDISDVLGFNNTGNVCVWPSEEILTHYCLQNRDLFKNKSVCELGGGMTCLAGIAVAACSSATDVLLTDGNVTSVDNVKITLRRNKSLFGRTDVSARVVRWDTPDKDLKSQYDIVICADCLFFDEYRSSLVDVIDHLLKPGGQVIIFAPSRGTTFQQFMDILPPTFSEVQKREVYDDHIWALHNENLAKGTEVYDPNLHYPMMLTFRKTDLKDAT